MSLSNGPGAARTDSKPKKQYKARIKDPWPDIHAIEVHLQAPNIMAAGKMLLERFESMQINEDHIVQLVEVEPR